MLPALDLGYKGPMTIKALSVIASSALVLWMLAAPCAAYGQGSTWAGLALSAMVESARWRLGVLRVNAAIELSDVGYDSDVYYGHIGDPVPDGIFSASVPVQILLPVAKRITLDIYDSPRYDFYLDTRNERGWNNTLRGYAHFALDKLYFQAGGELANNRRRFSQEADIHVREKYDSLSGLVLWQASRLTSYSLRYQRTAFDYGGASYGGTNLAEILNRREEFFSLAAYIQSNRRFRFFIDSQLQTYDFAAASSRFKNARSYALFGGFASVLREATPNRVGGITGSASLGYTYFDVLEAGLVDGSGITGNVNIFFGFMKLTSARVFFMRGFEFSLFSDIAFFVQSVYGTGLRRLISDQVSLSYDLSLARTSYPRTGAGGGDPFGVSNRNTTHSLSLNVMLAQDLAVTFVGRLGNRVLVSTGQVWNRNFFGISLIYGANSGMVSAPLGDISR